MLKDQTARGDLAFAGSGAASESEVNRSVSLFAVVLPVLRYCVAFCAVCLGAAVAAADFAVGLPLAPHQRRVPGKTFSENDRLIFDACITFYGIVYSAGRFLYRWLGAHAEAHELRRWSRWHMVVLNAFSGGWLVAAGWQALKQAILRPSLVVGAFLLALTACDAWRGFQNVRGKRFGKL